MKFKLTETDTYWWPVKVMVPDPDNAGQFQEQELEILLEAEDQDTALNNMEAYSALTTARDQVEHERERLLTVCKNWRGLDGDVPFSKEVFLQALGKTWFRRAVFGAYSDSLSGEAARLGN